MDFLSLQKRKGQLNRGPPILLITFGKRVLPRKTSLKNETLIKMNKYHEILEQF